MVTRRPCIVNVRSDGSEVTPVNPLQPLDSNQVHEDGASQPRDNFDSDEFFIDNTSFTDENVERHSNSTSTKHWGPTLMANVWNLPKNKIIKASWNNDWQPVGGEVSQLAHFIGTIARNPALCSLSYPTDWRLVPKDQKNELLQIVKSKFIIPNSVAGKYVLQSMGRKWSNFKAELKNEYFEPNKGNVSKVLNAKPDNVPRDQWISLVTYWSSPKAKERSIKNRQSRESQVMTHTAGSKRFARVIEEQTHKDRKTDPAPMDEKSRQAVEMINAKLKDLPNNKELTNGVVAWHGDIYSQVINEIIGPERRGRVRGLGRGPSSISSTTCYDNKEGLDNDHVLCNEKIQLLECELKKVNDKCVKIQEENLELQRKMQDELTMLKMALFGRDILNNPHT